MGTEREVLAELERVAQNPGFIHVLSAIVLRDTYYSSLKYYSDHDPYTSMSPSELDLVLGLLVKNELDTSMIREDVSTELENDTRNLLQDLHHVFNEPFAEFFRSELAGDQSDPSKTFPIHAMREPLFYAASSAYDFQYIQFVPEKFLNDSEWLVQNLGIDPTQLVKFFERVRDVVTHRVNIYQNSTEQTSRPPTDAFCVFRQDFADFPACTVDNLLDRFSVQPGKANPNYGGFGYLNDVEARPFVKLSEDAYYVPNTFAMARSIYESPTYWMFDDPQYSEVHKRNRGDFTESKTVQFMERVFGTEVVYRDVKVKKGKADITDIDVLVIYKNRLIVIQCKSKRLQILAKRGHEATILNDFTKAVQEAYEQALTAYECIFSRENYRFEIDGCELTLPNNVRDVFLCCVVSDDFPALTIMASNLLKKENSNSPYPICFTLFDLDVVVEYMSDPYDLFFYLQQRRDLYDKIRSTHERNFLGFHIQHRLYDDSEYDIMMLDEDFGLLIDADILVRREPQRWGRIKTKNKIMPMYKGQELLRFMGFLKNIRDDEVFDVVIMFLSISGKSVVEFFRRVKQIRKRAKKKGTISSFSIAFGDRGVTYSTGAGPIFRLIEPANNFAMQRMDEVGAAYWVSIVRSLEAPVQAEHIEVFRDGNSRSLTLSN